jgi:hypothetical protein
MHKRRMLQQVHEPSTSNNGMPGYAALAKAYMNELNGSIMLLHG